MENFVNDIIGVIADITELEVDEIKLESRFVDDLDVDSLLALEILASLEKKYQIEIPEEDLVKFTTVQQVVNITKEKLAA